MSTTAEPLLLRGRFVLWLTGCQSPKCLALYTLTPRVCHRLYLSPNENITVYLLCNRRGWTENWVLTLQYSLLMSFFPLLFTPPDRIVKPPIRLRLVRTLLMHTDLIIRAGLRYLHYIDTTNLLFCCNFLWWLWFHLYLLLLLGFTLSSHSLGLDQKTFEAQIHHYFSLLLVWL